MTGTHCLKSVKMFLIKILKRKNTRHKDFSAYLIKAIIRYLQKKTEQRQKKFKYFLTRTMYYSMLHHNIDV